MGSFTKQTFLILMRLIDQFFLLQLMLLMSSPRTLCPDPVSKDFLIHFVKNSVVLLFTLMSMIYLELQGARFVLGFTYSAQGCPTTPATFVEKVSFLH